MNILFAADGSAFTKKALAFLVTNPGLLGDGELRVLHVQPPLPPRVTGFVGVQCIRDYHAEEAARVLEPIEEFLHKHELKFKVRWVVGHAAKEIIEASKEEGTHMIVMGTHGYGLLGRALMGSVAQGVLGGSDVPVLLVK